MRALPTMIDSRGKVVTPHDLDGLVPKGRWHPTHKRDILMAIERGLISTADAMVKWDISGEELALWRERFMREGKSGLKALYR